MKKLFILSAITFLTLTAVSRAADPVKPYPLTTCVVSHEDFDGKPVVIVYKGQEVKFCCKQCVKKFNANPAKYMKTIEAAEKK